MKLRRWWWLVALALVVGVEALLRIIGAGAPPARFCPDGSPRGAFRYAERNRFPEARPNSSAPFVLCLGDGWTYGLGVAAEQAWPRLLQKHLKDAGVAARVANLGRVDATTADVSRQLAEAVKAYRPSRIVVLVGAQDAAPLALLEQYPLGNPDRLGDCERPLFRGLHYLARRRLALRWYVDDPDRPDNKEYLPRRGTVAQTKIALDTINDIARRSGVQPIFLTYPSLTQRRSGAPHLPLEGRYDFLIRDAVAGAGGRLVDLDTRWAGRTESFLLPWMLWPHPNAAGHADIAAAVAAAW